MRTILFLALATSGFAAAADAQIAPQPPAERPLRGGPITRADFVAQAAARFDRMDTNHDGVLDPAERATGRPLRGMRGGTPPEGPPPARPAGE